MDIEAFEKQAKRDEGANKKLFAKLRRIKPHDLDKHMHQFHDEAFDHIDCKTCANCCKTTSPIFYETDIERAADALKMKPGSFIQKYLHEDEDRDFVLNVAPCPFLAEDNLCNIYDARPKACREYPHTNRKKSYQIIDISLHNTLVCPAVLEIAQKLRGVYKSPAS